MNLEPQIRGIRWAADTLVDLAFVPVRLSKYFLKVLAARWLEYEQKQAWNRHVRGTYLDPESEGKPSYYDPRTHH